MKTIRFFLVSTLLASIAIAQYPAVAQCQMGFALAPTVCAMPCCKSIPMPKCPHVQAATPRYTITASPISFSTRLQAIFTLASDRILKPVLRDFAPRPLIDTYQSLVAVRTFASRAPPPGYIQQSA